MGLTRPKPKPDQTTDERLAAARADIVQIEGAILDAGRDRDLALLDDDGDAVRRAEATAGDLEKQKERAGRRVILLEQKAAAEQTARQEKAQTNLIERSEGSLREREAATAEMVAHFEAMIPAFRRAMAAGAAGVSGWPFGFGDTQAALVGTSFVQAIAAELYRLSGDDIGRAPQFPGAKCPDVRDTRPQAVKPLVDKVAEATAYALRLMRESPIRALPISAPAQPAPLPVAPAATAESEAAIQTDQPVPAKEDRPVEYSWFVDYLELATGQRKTERIVFTAEQVEETYLDGLGPLGPRGREMALRLAAASVAEGFQVDGRSLRFDMAALTRSIDDN